MNKTQVVQIIMAITLFIFCLCLAICGLYYSLVEKVYGSWLLIPFGIFLMIAIINGMINKK